MNKSVRTFEQGEEIGFWSIVSIGVGGMVGGAIFAVLGLSVQLAGGAVPIAFLIGGLVALATSYSYARLSILFPNNGGTVEFLNQAFGRGIFSGGLNVLLCLSYVVVLSLYAYAFGSFGASFFSAAEHSMWKHTFITAVIVVLTVINLIGQGVVVKSENLINAIKLIILLVFIVLGLWAGIRWERMAYSQWVPPLEIVAGGMIIFVNYEGFELISNAAANVRDRERILPLGHYTAVLLVLVFYCLIAVVSVGHLSPHALEAARDYALAASAQTFMGATGFTMIAVAALLATASAINATFFCCSRMTFTMAKEGEMPQFLEKVVWGIPAVGLIIVSVLTLGVANSLDLTSISTTASAGFLLIFGFVNVANLMLRSKTDRGWWISAVGALMCFGAFLTICGHICSVPESRWKLWIFAVMLIVSFGSEILYQIVGPMLRKDKESSSHQS